MATVEVRERSGEWASYDVSSDGSRFLVKRELESSYLPAPIHVVINWDQELQRLAEAYWRLVGVRLAGIAGSSSSFLQVPIAEMTP